MANQSEAVPRRSVLKVWREDTVAVVIAALAAAALAGTVLYLAMGAFSSDDEAPIRVRNGSLQFIIEDPDDEWTPSGASGNYRYRDGAKLSDDFEVIVIPAGSHTCNVYSRIGSDIEFTFSDEKTIRVQSQDRNTWLKPGTGLTLTPSSPRAHTLTYTPAGYLTKVAVNNQTLCTFTQASQLSSVVILDTP
jgi:hypothetical protein